jgi:uroporphyrinogen decarboxylase
MYETAWQIRGYEQFLMDLVEQPEWAECLLDKMMARNMVAATAAARAGVDLIYFGDDVANQQAMMFSLPMWRKFMLSRWAKVWSAVRSISPATHIWYHSDGNITPIVAELRDAGVTILNPVQPECVDPAELRKQYPNLNFHGTIGTQSTMPWGTPDDVRRVVRERVAACGANGRLMLGPTHVLEPEVPIANIEAFAEAARTAYGR